MYYAKPYDMIKRNEVAEPQWDEWDYATIAKEKLFSEKRWKKTVDWDIILKQVEKTRQASQMIDISLYPSTLFFAAVDMLEANLYVIDDMFYCLTGMRMIGTKPLSDEVKEKLGFWNMDCYKLLEQIEDGLDQTREVLIKCLQHDAIRDITLKVFEKEPLYKNMIGTTTIPTVLTMEECVNIYAREHYEVEKIDQEALATQFFNILQLIGDYCFFFTCIYSRNLKFPQLLAVFFKSEKAQREYIEPWRHDFGGTRDSLIAKMEKDPKLRPWVHRYDHLSKDREVFFQLFYDEKELPGPVDKEACFNTDNWISILTVAAVLQEYDEQHQTDNDVDEDDDEDILLKLYLYFKDEAAAQRFLKSAKAMNDTQIITLVKKYNNAGLCTDKSKALWTLLHDAGIYKTGYTNWNALLNK